jgi:hypothetical protein
LSREIVWDGKDDFGNKIGKGVYIYKLTVKSNLLNKSEKFEKLNTLIKYYICLMIFNFEMKKILFLLFVYPPEH